MTNIYDLTLQELEALLQVWGQPAYRARQIWRQVYVNLAASPAEMTDLPQALRDRLAAEVTFGSLTQVRLLTDDGGLTRKVLWQLAGGAVVESVLMVYPDRATVCVSTQAGCAMGCVFCATGKLGLLKNLTPGEIVQQAVWAARELRDAIVPTQAALPHLTNLVFMGMGEPFANYERWWRSVETLHHPQGMNMGARSMTVSTVGLPPGIRRLATEPLQVNLAISLHAPNDALRLSMMPINQRYPLSELLAATREYIERTNRRVSFEYVLLQGKNDTPALAAELAALIRGAVVSGPMLYHVNLIPWNPVPGEPLGRSERTRVLAFQRVLEGAGVPCTVRMERGVAIMAACGQLAGSSETIPLIEV
jgi:23S rRNA (adenine2503-C2)-methyltransferase